MQTKTITPDQLAEMVRETIERNRGVERTARSQAVIDLAVQLCYEEGEVALAAGILAMVAARVSGEMNSMLGVVMQHGIDRQRSRNAHLN